MRSRTRAVAAVVAVLLCLVMILLVAAPGNQGSEPVATRPGRTTSSTASGTPAPSVSTTAASPSTTAASPSTTAPTTTTTITAPVGPVLRLGSRGPEVLDLERRLRGLGYWLGPADDSYDSSTAHAVVAFQKQHGLARDGIAGSQVLGALAGAAPPRSRSPVGGHVEIDLGRQVLLVVDRAGAVTVLDVSTGRVAGTTPGGHFTVTREIDGYRHSPLGVLYRPKYFYGGVAVHGYPSVPPRPASHGCVRTTNAAMDWLWASGGMALGTPVWVYG